MHELWPPLHEIERRTRIIPDGLLLVENPTPSDLSDTPPENSPPMPAFLSKLVERGVAAHRQANQLREGAVVLFVPEKVGKLNLAPFAFCLNRLLSRQGLDEKWTGWLASPDIDYAGPYDVVLEPHDEPFDPHAGMIQTWNPMVLSLTAPMRLLAQLSEERLKLVREVQQQHVSGTANASPPSPGHVELRTVSAVSVLTGTSIGGHNDPRTRYQNIYRAVAQEFEPLAANDVSWFRVHRKQWYAMAATVVAGIGAVLIYGNMEGENEASVTVLSRQTPATVVAKVDHQSDQSPANTYPAEKPVPTQSAPSAESSPVFLEKPVIFPGAEQLHKNTETPVSESPQPDRKLKKSLPSRTELASAAPPRTASEKHGEKAEKLPTVPAEPMVLASLEEGRFAIAMIRSGNVPPSKREVSSPTHILRVIDTASLDKGLALFDSLGIPAAPLNSTVPALAVAIPDSFDKTLLDKQLMDSGLFLTRQKWLSHQN